MLFIAKSICYNLLSPILLIYKEKYLMIDLLIQ